MSVEMAGVLERLERLERENAVLRREVESLRTERPSTSDPAPRPVARRDLFRLVGAAAAGGLATTIAGAAPAAADNGDPVYLGQINTATFDTIIQSTATALHGTTSSMGSAAIDGEATSTEGVGIGVRGVTSGPLGVGVRGHAKRSDGFGTGVWGSTFADHGTGVLGEAAADSGVTYGVLGRTTSPSGFGVYSDGDAKVDGTLIVTGRTVSGTVRIRPAARPDTAVAGELAVDGQKRLWFCRGGSDWIRLA